MEDLFEILTADKYFTKELEDLEKAMNDLAYQEKVFKVLTRDKKFKGSFEDFKERFVKKKTQGSGLEAARENILKIIQAKKEEESMESDLEDGSSDSQQPPPPPQESKFQLPDFTSPDFSSGFKDVEAQPETLAFGSQAPTELPTITAPDPVETYQIATGQLPQENLTLAQMDEQIAASNEQRFDDSLKLLNEQLINKAEENAVPYLRSMFEEYGYEFEEATILADAMKVYGPDGTMIRIDLQPFGGLEARQNELQKLKDFMQGTGTSEVKRNRTISDKSRLEFKEKEFSKKKFEFSEEIGKWEADVNQLEDELFAISRMSASEKFKNRDKIEALNSKKKQLLEKEKTFRDQEEGLVDIAEGLKMERREVFAEEDTGVEKMFGKWFLTDFLGDMQRAWYKGQARGATVDESLALMNMLGGEPPTDEQIQDFIIANERMKQFGESDEMIAFSEAHEAAGGGIGGFIMGLIAAPTVVTEIFVSSVGAMATEAPVSKALATFSAIMGTAAAVGAAGGAGVGAAAGGVGAAPGAAVGAAGAATVTFPWALRASIGAMTTTLESGLTYAELLQEELGDKANDPEALRNLLNDEDKVNSFRNRAVARGMGIGAVDAITFGVASMVTKSVASATGKKLLAIGAGIGTESVGGSLGEITGMIMAGQKLDSKEILFEGIGGTATAPLSVAYGLYKTPTYKLNGEITSGKDMAQFIRTATDKEVAQANITIQNDNTLLNVAKEKRNKAIERYNIDRDIDPEIKGEARERLIALEIERTKLVNKKTQNAKNKLKQIDKEINEISEGKYTPKEKSDIETFFETKEKTGAPDDGGIGEIKSKVESEVSAEEGVRKKDEEGVDEEGIKEAPKSKFTTVEESISIDEAPLSENQKQEILNETGSIDDNDSITIQSVDETGKAVVKVSRTNNATGQVSTTQVSVQLSPDQQVQEKVKVDADTTIEETRGEGTVKEEGGTLEVTNNKYSGGKVKIKGKKVSEGVYITTDPDVKGAVEKNPVSAKVKQVVINSAIKVAKAIKKIAPGVNIILAQNKAEFQKVSGRTKNIMGTYNTQNNDIYINLEAATPGTIAHEAFHAILRNGAIKVKAISASLKPTVKSIKKILQQDAKASKDPTKHKALLEKIEKYLKYYNENAQNEEFVAEIIGEFSKDFKTLPVPAQNKVIEFIKSVFRKVGLSKAVSIESLTSTDTQIGESLNSIITALTEGKDVKQADVKGIIKETPTTPTKKVSSVNPITKKKVDNDKVVEGDLDRMGEAPAVEDGVQVEFYHNTDPNKKTLQQKIEGSFTPEEGTKTPYSDSYGYKNKKYTGNAPDNFLFVTPKAKAGYDMLGPKYKVRAKFNKPYFVDRNKVWTQEEVNDLIADGYDVIITGQDVKGDIKNISEAKDVIPLDKSKIEIVGEVTVREKTPADTQIIEKYEGPVSEVRTVDTGVDTDMDKTQLDMFDETPTQPTKKTTETPSKQQAKPKRKTPPKRPTIREVLKNISMSNGMFINPRQITKDRLQALVKPLGYTVHTSSIGHYFLKKDGKMYNRESQTDLDKKAVPDKDNISKMLPKERESKLKQYIKDARDNNFTDKEISEYLIKVKKFSKKEVDAIMKKGEKGLIPDSFTNLKKDKDSVKGIRLYKRVAKYAMSLIERNKTRKNPLSKSQIMDRVIKYLEEQPEFKAEADTYTAKGKAKKQRGLSEQQAKMQTEIQALVGERPTVDMRARLSQTRRMINDFIRGRKSLSEVKTQLRNFMRQTLPKDVYTKPEVMKLIKKIDLVTKATLPGIMQEVVEFAAKKNIESLTKQVRNKINGTYSVIQGGRKKGYKIDADAQEQMDKIKEYSVKDNATPEERTAQNEKLLKEYKKISEKAQLTEEDMNTMVALEIAMELNNVGLMENSNPNKAQSLLNINSQLDELIFGGKERLMEEVAAKHEEYKRNTEIAYKEITGEDIDLDTEEGRAKLKKQINITNAREQAKAKQPKIVRALRSLLDYTTNFFTTGMDIATLMNKISVTPGEMFGGKLQELVTDKIDAGTREFKARKMINQELIRSKLKELYGPKWKKKARKMKNVFSSNIYLDVDAVNVAREEYNKNKNTETKANLKKVIEENTIADVTNTTQNKLYYLYNQFKDPANHPAFEKMWGPDYKRVAAEIEAALDPETKQFADWQVDELFPMLYEHYNRKYREIYRTNLPWNENYAGRIYRDGIDYKPLDLLGGDDVMQTSVGAASQKVRVNTTEKIDGRDGTDVLLTYLNDMEWFSAMASPLKDVNKMLLNPDIKSLIKNIYGETTFKMIDAQIQKVAAKGIRSDMGSETVNLMTDVFIVSKLGLNPTVTLKQLTSFITYANDIGPIQWIKHAPKTPSQLLKTWKEIRENSVYLKDRKYNSITKTIESYNETGMESVVPVSTKEFIVNFLMWTTKFGDRSAIYLGGMSNYNFYKAEFKKKNPQATEQQAIDYAILKFERDTKRTQQSNDLHDKDYFQTSHPVVRPFNMFLTTPKQYLRKEMQAMTNMYRKILSGGKQGKGTWMQNLRTFGLYHVVMPVFFQYVAMGLPGLLRDRREGDEEDLIRAAVIGNLNGLFIMGDVIQGIADGIQGKPWAEDVSRGVPIFEKVAEWNRVSNQINTIKGYKDYGKPNAKGREYQERINLLLKKKYFILVEASGLPATQVSRFFDNYKEIFEGGVPPREVMLRLFNYSEYQIKGPKQKDVKKKEIKLTKEELKRYRPEEYHRQRQEELRKKNSPAYKQEQQRKKEEKRRREEQLRRIYNR